MKFLFFLILLPTLCFGQETTEDHLFLIKLGEKKGYINSFGKIVVPIEFDHAGEFSEGVSYIRTGKEHICIDTNGKEIQEIEKSNCDFKNGLSFGKTGIPPGRDSERGVIDRAGKFIFKYDHKKLTLHPEHWQWSYFSDERLLMLDRETKKLGYLDMTGAMLIPAQFKDARPFSEGLAVVKIFDGDYDDRWRLIDKQGQFLKCPDGKIFNEDNYYQWLGDGFSEGLLQVMHEGAGFGFVDRNCQVAVPLQYEQNQPMKEGLAAVKVNGRFGFIDKAGKMVIEPKFYTFSLSSFAQFSDGLCPVFLPVEGMTDTPERIGFIDKTGKLAIDYRFSDIRPFSHGLARVAEPLNETDPATDMTVYRVGYIDKTGRFVWETKSAGLFPLW